MRLGEGQVRQASPLADEGLDIQGQGLVARRARASGLQPQSVLGRKPVRVSAARNICSFDGFWRRPPSSAPTASCQARAVSAQGHAAGRLMDGWGLNRFTGT